MIRKRRFLFVAIGTAFLTAIFVGIVVKHSYSFTVRADGACAMRLHYIHIKPNTAKILVLHVPKSGVTMNNRLEPNALTFYILRLDDIGHPEIAISNINGSKPSLKIEIDDDVVGRSKAMGGIIEFSVNEALRCEK